MQFKFLEVFNILTDYIQSIHLLWEPHITELLLCLSVVFPIMEDNTHLGSAQQDSTEVPSLIKLISSNEVAGFDEIKRASVMNDQCQTSESESLSPSTNVSWFLIHVSRMISTGLECLNKHLHIITIIIQEIFTLALQDLLCGIVSMFILLLAHRKIKSIYWLGIYTSFMCYTRELKQLLY